MTAEPAAPALPCGPNADDRYCARYWELSAEVDRLRAQCDDYPELVADRDRLRAELDDIGTICANAPEDGDSFGLLEELAMRIAAFGTVDEPRDGRHPDGCTCQFCREDEREERDRADRQDADDDGYPDSERDMDALAYQRGGDDERDDQ